MSSNGSISLSIYFKELSDLKSTVFKFVLELIQVSFVWNKSAYYLKIIGKILFVMFFKKETETVN